MATLPNQNADNDSKNPETSSDSIVPWVMKRVVHGREIRDGKFGERWDEYARLWRGFWTDDDKNNSSERSKLVAPALQQAVEMTVAELEEAVFSKSAWFEIDDDKTDLDTNPQSDDALKTRDALLEDFAMMGVEDAISKTFLLGAVYGTGIAKLNVVKKQEMIFDQKLMQAKQKSSYKVAVEYVRPDEFIIDPTATTIEEALFCAVETIKPRHSILEKQKSRIYNMGYVGKFTGNKPANTDGGATSSITPDDNAVLITEYYGKVPAYLLDSKSKKEGEESMDRTMVEAIVIIANEDTLLRAVRSPFVMQDRPIVAYQHDTVPGEFWGRGVCEKGYNPQKALDAELRARIDALALMTAPMMGADITRLPRNPELTVRPGKTVFTRGRPSEIYEPVAFGNPAQLGATFQQTGDLERMVQMGTGAIDSQTPTGVSRRNETAGGMSMMLAGMLKRTKRTMQNIERQFLNPLIRKASWRYMQFDPQRYGQDFKFVVASTMGIMAKEMENQQLIQMLGFVPPESPAHMIIVKALFDNTPSADKAQLREAIDQLMKPPDPQQQQMQQQMQQIQAQTLQAELTLTQAQGALAQAKAMLAQAQTQHEKVDTALEPEMMQIQAVNAAAGAHKAKIAERQTLNDHHANVIQHHSNVMKATNDAKKNEIAARKPVAKKE